MAGFGAELVGLNPERLRHTDNLDDAATLLRADLDDAATAQAHAGVDVLSARGRDVSADSVLPHVLLAAAHSATGHRELEQLLDDLRQHPGRAPVSVVLIDADPDADPLRHAVESDRRWCLHVTETGRLQVPALGLDLIAQRLPAEHAAGIARMVHHAEHNDDRPMPPSSGGQPYEAYCDAAGALRHELTLPRRPPNRRHRHRARARRRLAEADRRSRSRPGSRDHVAAARR